MRIRTMSIVPTLFLGIEYCATFQAALYIETHSLMHQSEFHAASVALSRATDKRKSLINIHKNGYTATLNEGKFLVQIFILGIVNYQSDCSISQNPHDLHATTTCINHGLPKAKECYHGIHIEERQTA